MPKFAKRFLIAVVTVLVVVAIVCLCINIYLQSAGVQQRIRIAAAEALGSEPRIASTMFTPWEGLVLRGVSIPDPTRPDLNLVEVTALRIRFAFLPLLQQRFVVTECALFEPRLLIRQLPDGNWQVPAPPISPEAEPQAATAGEKPAKPKALGPAFRSELHRFRVGGGTLTFVDAGSRIVLRLEATNLDAQIQPDLSAKGTFRIGKTNISNSLFPRKISGDFTWDGRIFDVPDINGSLAGGKILGQYRLVNGDEPTFTIGLQLNKIQLRMLAEEAGLDPGQTEGEMEGTLDLTGDPRHSEELTGKGHLELISAKLRPVEFLVKLGELLRIDELQLLSLKDAHMDISVGNKHVQVEGIVLRSENLVIRGQGPVKFDGKMDLSAELLVNKKLQQQLKGFISKNFQPSEDPEYKQVPFKVTGKVSSPKTDLLDKLIGINIGQDVGGLLKNLFRPPSTPKQDEQKD